MPEKTDQWAGMRDGIDCGKTCRREDASRSNLKRSRSTTTCRKRIKRKLDGCQPRDTRPSSIDLGVSPRCRLLTALCRYQEGTKSCLQLNSVMRRIVSYNKTAYRISDLQIGFMATQSMLWSKQPWYCAGCQWHMHTRLLMARG